MMEVVDGNYVSLGYRQNSSLSSAKALGDATWADPAGSGDTGIPDDATHALLQAVTKNVRVRTDNVAPAASEGMQIAAGASLWITASDLSKVKVIEESATAQGNVEFYRRT